MKKFNPVYFLPAVPVAVVVLISVFVAGDDALGYAKGIFYLVLLVTSGVLLCLGKPWGILPGVSYYTFVAVTDWVQNYKRGWFHEIPEYTYCIPIILFYISCALYVEYKNKHPDFKISSKDIYKVWFFAPPILLFVISYGLSGKSALTTLGMWIAIAFMFGFGIVMCKDKSWGAAAAALFWLLWGIVPYFLKINMFRKDTVLDMLLTVPMAVIYIACAVVIIKMKKTKNKTE